MTSFQDRDVRRRAIQWRNGPVGPVLIVVAVIAGLVAMNAIGRSGAEPEGGDAVSQSSPSPVESAHPPESRPPAETASPGPPAAVTLPGGVWYAEQTYGQWVMGAIEPGPGVVLPAGALPLAGGSGLVVASMGSPEATTVTVYEARTGRIRAEVAVPFLATIASVTPGGAIVYFGGRSTGQPMAGIPLTDTGIWALSVETGALTQVTPVTPERPEWEGNFERGAASVSPTGRTLATTLCGGPPGAPFTCDVQVVDLATRALVGAFGPMDANVAAATDDTVYVRTQFVVIAFNLDGTERWRFTPQEVQGVPVAVPDGLLVPYAAVGTVNPTRLGKLASATGTVTDLLVAETNTSIDLWPTGPDATRIVGSLGVGMTSFLGLGKEGAVDVFTLDTATGQVARGVLQITTPAVQP